MASPYPHPKGGASLFVSLKLASQKVILVGSGTSAASRAYAALDSDATVTVLTSGGYANACDELKYRSDLRQITILDEPLETYLATSNCNDIRYVCITDTTVSPFGVYRRSRKSALEFYGLCKRRGILVNTHDMPDLCDFTFPATQRIGESLQIAVTTNGKGCRIAGRIKRHVVASLPKDAGDAVMKVGQLRQLAKARQEPPREEEQDVEEDDVMDDCGGSATPNRPVPSRNPSLAETDLEGTRRRMKWVAQVSEYWAFSQLAALTQEEMMNVLDGEANRSPNTSEPPSSPTFSQHQLPLSAPPKKGRIFLLGSGPGHPSLLTVATMNVLTKHADLVLSDKLVPSQVLDVIPKGVTVRIARKFPGNAEGAQMEMMEAAIEGANKGLTVVRLKQGDPTIYGRSSEEIIYFRHHGYESLLIPGVSSSIAAPSFANIPLTQRGVSESAVICTGVGRGGKGVELPGYVRPRALVVLMGVARINNIVKTLTDPCVEGSRRNGPAYPPHLPIAIIERASMPDQRVIKSTLGDIEEALNSSGEQRPPGMMVIGWCVMALDLGEESMRILDDGQDEERDRERVGRWLGSGEGRRWVVSEGLERGWEDL
ncbi:uroporphyrin-III C-methyltransferase [Pterulicium gracile]|uniref:precorrin-2 dehydrogenase n=1 Tax=Pterulicium gracile TaxID=1884261 RepID=A0A5C3QRS6_9AGAR|nr:uroporphyrin-III C-methyltransferase [Pterula gracilis]